MRHSLWRRLLIALVGYAHSADGAITGPYTPDEIDAAVGEEEEKQFLLAYDKMDHNKDGILSWPEVLGGIAEDEFEPEEVKMLHKLARKAFPTVDANSDRHLDRKEFIAMAKILLANLSEQEEL
eukprot:TRINITY_DN33800_c0_g1_i1.p1 TRINITY_DN33800_c0_g1~~TRINITY_DN33800_c0_g1_i1.p1  ORF type:complete len:124 (-),score=24.10 TRINITY_DN33800_c0_g1_i1:107-478(-)